MKNCTDFIDLISAYSDGELNDSDKISVDEHVAVCENCSALLGFYNEISISVSETNAHVPDALCVGVMNRIKNENLIEQKEEPKKKWWNRQAILTRYAPIAACFAVLLLAWQVQSNISQRNNNVSHAPVPVALSDVAADMGPMEAETEMSWSADDANAYSEPDMIQAAGGAVDDEDSIVAATSSPQALDGESAVEADAFGDRIGRRTDAYPLEIGNQAEQIIGEPSVTLSIIEGELTATGATYSISNTSNIIIEFGRQFTLQINVEGTWYEITPLMPIETFMDMFVLNSGIEESVEIDWLMFYGELPPGTYRLVKEFYYKHDSTTHQIAGEFTIR